MKIKKKVNKMTKKEIQDRIEELHDKNQFWSLHCKHLWDRLDEKILTYMKKGRGRNLCTQ